MIKLGIIGTGRIANRFLTELSEVEGIEAACVYNPHIESARRFAESGGIPEWTDRLDRLAALVDAVYIASPHHTHYEYACEFLRRRKHVLCEKPMVMREQEARELFRLAEENGCILMEAIKTAYCPGYLAMIETAKSGLIGTVRDVEACFTKLTPTNVRELTDEQYGGSFTEMGTYTLLPVLQLLGTQYEEAHFRCLRAGNGVDGYTKAEFIYKEACGLAKTGLLVKSEGQLVIAGSKGYILAQSPWWLTKEFEVRFEDPALREVHTCEFKGAGLRYEIRAFVKAVQGENSSCVVPEVSIRMAAVMEKFLEQEKQARMQSGLSEVETQESAGRDRMYRYTKDTRNLKIWAHRGMSYAYPENTLVAFDAAAKLDGITGIEFDVQMTKDGELVVIHDEQVDRVAEGTGAVIDYTLDEIKKLRLKNVTQEKVGIPSLKEVLVLLKPYCLAKNLLINIELKNSQIRYKGMENLVLQLVKDQGLEPYVWYSSFLPESMNLIKNLEPFAHTGVLASSVEECIVYGETVGADAIHPYTGGMNASLPEKWKGRPVRAWNCEELLFGQDGVFREHDLRKYVRFGVTDVFTNVPEWYLSKE